MPSHKMIFTPSPTFGRSEGRGPEEDRRREGGGNRGGGARRPGEGHCAARNPDETVQRYARREGGTCGPWWGEALNVFGEYGASGEFEHFVIGFWTEIVMCQGGADFLLQCGLV